MFLVKSKLSITKYLFLVINTLLLYTSLLASQYILKNNETFSNLSVTIVSQKYREFSMQVENCE
jgi:hypothetical protein